MKSLRCPTRSSARSRNWLSPPSIPRQGPSLNILAAIVFANCPPIHRSERSPPTPPFSLSFPPKKTFYFRRRGWPGFFSFFQQPSSSLFHPWSRATFSAWQTTKRRSGRPLDLYFPPPFGFCPPPFVGVGARFCFALLGRPKTRLQPLPSSPAMATFCRPRPLAKIGRHHRSV